MANNIIPLGCALMVFALFVPLSVHATDNRDCIWGTTTEQTTYQKPYNPILAPEIPVIGMDLTGKQKFDSSAISPETAIRVVSSDGKCYSYFYKEITRYQLRPEYRYLAVRMPELITPPLLYRPAFPKTSQKVGTVVQSQMPVDLRYYNPITVRVKVVIPCEPGVHAPCVPAGPPKIPGPVSFQETPGASSVGVTIEAKP